MKNLHFSLSQFVGYSDYVIALFKK